MVNMKIISKVINEKGIALIILTVIILIAVVITTLVFKAVIDSQSIGITTEQENFDNLIRSICRIQS